ncbi:hypothetical protein [Pseudoxanthomonas mexicana]|uniref:hypothetical protein n=1 Tax=Pseudoxanthomonas mexicana TaxID=128785 RepID=UPI0028ACEF49|nr:hypothetical protein [Pseudoxanthomonas mexicana]
MPPSTRPRNSLVSESSASSESDLSFTEMIGGEIHGDRWVVIGCIPGAAPSSMTVGWAPFEAGNEPMFWSDWKKYGQKLVQALYESPEHNVNRGTSLVTIAREVRSFCQFCCAYERLPSIDKFGPSHLESYLHHLEGLKISEANVSAKLSVLSYAWELRDAVGTGIERSPFFFREKAALARKIGVENGHTPTIPPADLFWILNEAIRMVERAPELIKDFSRYLKLRESAGRNVSGVYRAAAGRSSDLLLDDVYATYGACIVIILAFTAARKHEGASIDDRDAARTAQNHVDIVSHEYKGSGTNWGRKTSRPVVPIVAQAIDVVLKLTAATRKKSRIRKLLLRLPVRHSVSGGRTPRFALDSRCLYSLLDAFGRRAGTDIKLRPHMFRRAYALLWVWRFEVGDLYFLSRILLHNSVEYTLAYSEDERSWDYLPEAMREMTVEILEDSLLGSRALTGGMSSSLRRYARILQASVTVARPEDVDALVRRLVDVQGIRVRAHADGYCFMSVSRGKYAKCSLDGVRPNYSNRTALMCAACPNFGVDLMREDIWRERLERHERVAKQTQFEVLASESRKAVVACKKILRAILKGRS